MLIEFSVANYRSFRDRQAFSFVATTSREHEKTHVFDPKTPGVERLLRSAVMYGANAAGKSNLLRAIDTMHDIVLLRNQLGDSLPVTQFLLDDLDKSKGSQFEVVFIEGGCKYQFGFVCTSERVIEEWLYAFPDKRAQKWYHRTLGSDAGDCWDFGGLFRGKKKDWSEATRSNALFLSTAIQMNAEPLRPVFDWFKSRLRVVVGVGAVAKDYTTQMLVSHSEKIVDLVKNADSGISAFELFKKSPGDFFEEILKKTVDEDIRDQILNSASTAVRVKRANNIGSDIWFDLDDESEGTQKLFAWAGPFLDVLENGLVLIIDELNNSLHPVMVKWIVDTFNNSTSNPNNAQLFFATHGTSVLSLDIFRRDQIWFAEKSKSGSTAIYPLTDFSPRKEVALSKGYLNGRYGAIPFLAAGNIE